MIHINLLPVRQIKKRLRAVNELIVFALSLAVLLVGIGIASGVVAHTISSLNQDIVQLTAKKNSYNPILKQIAELKKTKLNLEAKINTIKKLKKGSQVTVRILDELANRTPSNRIWLKSLKQTGNSLKLDAVALDNATIAQYMDSLGTSPLFSVADLDSTKQIEVAGQKLKSFSLNVGITTAPAEEGKHQGPASGGGK